MAIDVDNAFVKQFESEVHMAYQRMGSKLRNMVRTKSNVKGESTTFQTVGTGVAGQKSRHGNVPTMSISHTPVECTLADYYAADYIDKLDELKVNHDERAVVAESGAAALGRRTDLLISTVMNTFTSQTTATGGFTEAKAYEVFEAFGEADVPDDGQRYIAVAPQSWTDLIQINAFSNQDYVGTDDLPYKGGMTAKNWLGFTIFMHSGLELSGTTRSNYAWHKTAVAHASGADVKTELNYVPEKAAHLSNAMMSQGAVLIDDNGGYNIRTTE
jgi:hypothetical protein